MFLSARDFLFHAGHFRLVSRLRARGQEDGAVGHGSMKMRIAGGICCVLLQQVVKIWWFLAVRGASWGGLAVVHIMIHWIFGGAPGVGARQELRGTCRSREMEIPACFRAGARSGFADFLGLFLREKILTSGCVFVLLRCFAFEEADQDGSRGRTESGADWELTCWVLSLPHVDFICASSSRLMGTQIVGLF